MPLVVVLELDVIAMSTDADKLAGSLHAAFACRISVAK
jgi:hypothetical protein